jgi:hypothetical protein
LITLVRAIEHSSSAGVAASSFRGDSRMKNLCLLCAAICIGFAAPAFARGGGMGSHHSSALGIPVTGGASGERVSSPGTNSLGTALSSSGYGSTQKGPLLGTSSAVDREEVKVTRALTSVCRGC